jgi:arylesterase/paraoxonase
VAFLSASSVLVTNDHFFTPRNWFWLNTLETYLALPLGDITHIDLATQKTTKVARVAFANGIAVMDAGNTVAVASSSGARVLFYDITAQEDASAPPILTPKKEKIQAAVSTPFFPDNLHVTANNSLLVAGHAHLSSLTTFVKQREVCEEDTTSTGCDAVAPSYVMQWSEQKGLESIYLGTEIYTSSGVCMDVGRGVLMVSGLYGKGLLVWDE